MMTSTYGVGQLIQAAMAEGATQVVLGLGGCGTNDGGAGMLAALGAGDPQALAAGGAKLKDLTHEALYALGRVRGRRQGIERVDVTDGDSTRLWCPWAGAVR